MKVMVIGGGGREHALIKALRKSAEIDKIYALPGNGGIAADAECVAIGATDTENIVQFARQNGIGFAVVAPDDPLVLGCADALEAAGIPAFGPSKAAAAIEGSKVFAKDLMKKYGIPTAAYEVFNTEEAALAYLQKCAYPTVVKADGLALGKGVTVAADRDEAEGAVHALMTDKIFGTSGNNIVIEEFLTGPEVSVLCFTDGKTVKPMASSMDHKCAYDGDKGPNTGGMGTVAPNPYYTADIAERCMREIFLPTVAAMNAEGRPFKGCLYFGLMLTPQGPKVIEYNCRFGDPETQVVLPLLASDLFTIMKAVRNGTLSDTEVVSYPRCACCVVVASGGYPVSYRKNLAMTLPDSLPDDGSVTLYHAGTAYKDGSFYTAGGRVIGVAATADTLSEARDKAYLYAKQIKFENSFMRGDIGVRALAAAKEGE